MSSLTAADETEADGRNIFEKSRGVCFDPSHDRMEGAFKHINLSV